MNLTREEADLIFSSNEYENQINCFYSVQKYVCLYYSHAQYYCEQHHLSEDEILTWHREDV